MDNTSQPMHSSGFTDETPRDYHCNLGPAGLRRDADERPELCRGTIDFVASKEYMALGDVYGSGVSEIELGTAQRTGVKVEVERPSNSAREKGFNMPAQEERAARRSDFDRYAPGGFNDLRPSRSTIGVINVLASLLEICILLDLQTFCFDIMRNNEFY